VGEFVSKDDKPVCIKCHENPTFAAGNSNYRLATLEAKSSGKICGVCQQDISGRFLSARGKFFHPDCFKCADCATAIEAGAGGFTIMEDDSLLCRSCTLKRTQALNGTSASVGGLSKTVTVASGGDCFKCQQPIKGEWLEAEGHKWHGACFTCSKCHSVLKQGFSKSGGQNYCLPCASHLQGGGAGNGGNAGSRTASPAPSRSAPSAPVSSSISSAATTTALSGSKFCPHCGAKTVGTKFCSSCGGKL